MKQVPLNGHDSIASLLRALMAANSRKSRPVSQRLFARWIGWPASFLNDVLKGRKPMTVVRGLELSKSLDLDVVDTERIVMLSLRGRHEEAVRNFAARGLAELLDNRRLDRPSQISEDVELGLLSDAAVTAILTVLEKVGRRLPSAEICRQLVTYPDLTVGRVDSIVTRLQEAGLVVIDADGRLDVGEGRLIKYAVEGGDNPEARLTTMVSLVRSTLQSADAFLDHLQRPCSLYVGQNTLRRSTVLTYRKRAMALYNWLMRESERDRRVVESGGEDPVQAFEFIMALYPLCLDEEARVSFRPRPEAVPEMLAASRSAAAASLSP